MLDDATDVASGVTGPPDALAAWRAADARRVAVTGCGLLLLLASIAADLATGPATLPIRAVLRSLAGYGGDPMLDAIVRHLRLPIALMAAAVGAALGISGAVMQTILNNPLASSYTLGISAGAGFGAALAILVGAALPLPEAWAVPVAAFLFAGTRLRRRGRRAAGCAAPRRSCWCWPGIACLFLFQALLSLLQFLASPEALQQIVFWLFGSLVRSTLPKVGIVTLVLAATLPVLLRRRLAADGAQAGRRPGPRARRAVDACGCARSSSCRC